MKKLTLFIVLLITGSCLALAHDKDVDKKEKMFREVQEFKMKYLAQEMELSEVQKKKFFDVYEEMERSKMSVYKEAVTMDRRLKKQQNPTEEEYQKVTDAFNNANAKWAEQEKIYKERLSEFLTPKQIYKMKEGEQSFKAKLDEMRQKKKKEHHKKHSEKN